MVTVVSFVIVDDGTRLQKEKGSPPSAPFGVLRLRPGKSLFVIASYEPEENLREKVDEALKKIASTTDPETVGGRRPGNMLDRLHGGKFRLHATPPGPLPSSDPLKWGECVSARLVRCITPVRKAA